jgi:hypothetical protein
LLRRLYRLIGNASTEELAGTRRLLLPGLVAFA